MMLFLVFQIAPAQNPVPEPIVKLVEVLSTPLGSIIFGGTFFVLLASIASLAWGLLKYGSQIKKLNEFETVSRLAALANSMEGTTASYGRISLKLHGFDTRLHDFDNKLREFNEDLEVRFGTLTSKLNAVETAIEIFQPSIGERSAFPHPQGQRSLNDPQDQQNWASIQSGWREVRDAIEGAIERLHGLARKKYSDAPRYSYSQIIQWLHNDNVFSSKVAHDAQTMNRLFLSIRPRNAVIDARDVDEFKSCKSRVMAELKRFKATPRARQNDQSSEVVTTPINEAMSEDEALERIKESEPR